MKVKCLYMREIQRDIEERLAYEDWCAQVIADPSTHVIPTFLTTTQ